MAIQHSNSSSSLADILERVLDKGIVVAGDIKISLADVDLLNIKIRLLVASVDKAKEMGIDWWQHDPYLTSRAQASPALPPPSRAVNQDNQEVLEDRPKSEVVDYHGSTSIDAYQGINVPKEVTDFIGKESLNDYSWAEKLNNEHVEVRASSLGKPSIGTSIEKIPRK